VSLFLGRNNLSLGAEGWEKHKLLPADPSSLTEGILAGTPDRGAVGEAPGGGEGPINALKYSGLILYLHPLHHHTVPAFNTWK
jgi:hypothetical protein